MIKINWQLSPQDNPRMNIEVEAARGYLEISYTHIKMEVDDIKMNMCKRQYSENDIKTAEMREESTFGTLIQRRYQSTKSCRTYEYDSEEFTRRKVR